jgi:hypothetical protein
MGSVFSMGSVVDRWCVVEAELCVLAGLDPRLGWIGCR